jgi:hypothetical protein
MRFMLLLKVEQRVQHLFRLIGRKALALEVGYYLVLARDMLTP